MLNHNLRRKNITFLNQLRSRNITNDIAINSSIIHAWFENRNRVFRSCCEEIATIRFVTEELSCREEVTLNRVVCLVKVNVVHFNVCLLNTMQRVISGEDDNILTSSPGSVSKQMDLFGFSSVEILNITTVNVHHMCVSCINQLKKFLTELFCQKNTRSNNDKSLTTIDHLNVSHNIINHTDGLATTGRDDDLTFAVVPHRIDCFLLMGAKGDGQVVSVSMNIL